MSRERSKIKMILTGIWASELKIKPKRRNAKKGVAHIIQYRQTPSFKGGIRSCLFNIRQEVTIRSLLEASLSLWANQTIFNLLAISNGVSPAPFFAWILAPAFSNNETAVPFRENTAQWRAVLRWRLSQSERLAPNVMKSRVGSALKSFG